MLANVHDTMHRSVILFHSYSFAFLPALASVGVLVCIIYDQFHDNAVQKNWIIMYFSFLETENKNEAKNRHNTKKGNIMKSTEWKMCENAIRNLLVSICTRTILFNASERPQPDAL